MADDATQVAEDEFTFESAANKTFPLAPEGLHQVTVAKATFSMRENSFAPEKGKQPYCSLMLQSKQEYTPEGEDKPRPYNLFMRFKISDHSKSTMLSFFNDVLGIPVPLSPAKKITLQRKEIVKEGSTEAEVHLPQFENLEFSALVKHKKSEDGSKTFDNVDSVFTSPEQKALNAKLFLAP